MKRILCVGLVLLLPAVSLPAKTVIVPFGTTIYCELDQAVTTRQKEPHAVQPGDIVQAHVWRDVWVDGHRVVVAGTPVYAKVSEMKKAKMAGQKGRLEIEVLSVQGVDRQDIPIDGGYDRSGKSRMGVTIGLAVALAWPFVFIKGKNVFLEPGTIFDALVRATTEIEVGDSPTLAPAAPTTGFEVSVVYEQIDPDKKLRQLPLLVQAPEAVLSTLRIVSVNGETIVPIQVMLTGVHGEAEDSYDAVVDFKVLSKHFRNGMNRFAVEMAGEQVELMLEIEL